MKKIVIMLSFLASVSACFNLTSCNKDDDDNNSTEYKDSSDSGKADGQAFADAYTKVKNSYSDSDSKTEFLSNLLLEGDGARMISLMKKYKNSEDKVYKTSFVSASSGVTGWTESTLEKFDVDNKVNLVKQLIELFTGTPAAS